MSNELKVEKAWDYFQAGQSEQAVQLSYQIVAQNQTLHIGEWNQLITIFQQTGHAEEAEKIAQQVKQVLNSDITEAAQAHDPTILAPGGYTLERASEVYGEAFRLCFEYLYNAGPPGILVEFGTYKGFTARQMALLMKEFNFQSKLYLYDSFKGFPEIVSSVDQNSYEVVDKQAWLTGHMRLAPNIPDLIQQALGQIIDPEQVEIIPGFFEETLPQCLPEEPAALIHIDCDLYESTRFVLEQLLFSNLLQDGSLILFDDYNCNRANPRLGERKAFEEFLNSQSRFSASLFFNYGWNGKAFFIHDGLR